MRVPFSAKALLLSLLLPALSTALPAQQRVNDRDTEALIRNFRGDVHDFSDRFKNAVGHTSIRKTSRERQAKDLVQSLYKQATEMLDRFHKSRQANSEFASTLATAGQVNTMVTSVGLDDATLALWSKARNDLSEVAAAFNAQGDFERTMQPAGPPPGVSAAASVSCTTAAGPSRATQMVEDCLKVSVSTHPACNAQNSCQMIVDEIHRGCSALGANAPALCSQY